MSGDMLQARAPDSSRVISAFCLTLAPVFWLASLSGVEPDNLDDFGLISVLPWTTWASLILLSVGFSYSLRVGTSRFIHAIYLIMLVLVLHGTPAITYGTLRYSWAWKHLGIVDYFQRHGTLDPNAPFLAAYHNWPGFFVTVAVVSDVLGLNATQLAEVARFTSPALNLLFIAFLPLIFRTFTSDWRLILVATWIFVLGNWVGQDYFSPQGVAFLIYLVIICLCLGSLSSVPSPAGEGNRPSISMAGRVLKRLFFASQDGASDASAIVRAICSIIVLLSVVFVAASHQLTPLVIISALAALAAIGRLSFGYSMFAGAAAALWILYFAAPFVAVALPEQVARIGEALGVMSARLSVIEAATPGSVWVTVASRVLTGCIVSLACIGGVRRFLAGHRDGSAIVLALAPLPLLVATTYGGEIIFRVYLFAVPFLAFFAAAVFLPSTRGDFSSKQQVAFVFASLALAVGFLLANNGKDRQYRFSPDEVAAARWLYEQATPATLLVEGARSYPSQFRNYENFTYLPIANESGEALSEIQRDPANVIGRWLSDGRWQAGFVLITRSQKAYADVQGRMPAGALDRIEQALIASPRFQISYASKDATIFKLNSALIRTRGQE